MSESTLVSETTERVLARRALLAPAAPRVLATVLAYAVAVAVGVGTATLVKASGHWEIGLPWERALMLQVHAHPLPHAAAVVLLALPWLGTNITLLPLSLGASLWLWLARGRRDLALWLMTVEVGCLSLTWLLKQLAGRPRPSLWPRVGWYGWGSFPSGHSLISVALLGTVALMLYRERRWRWPAVVVLCLVATIWYSRVYHGVHWPTDVIGGAAVGATWLVGTSLIFAPRSERH